MEAIAYIRDFAMYAAIFGMFAFMWFGWAQENPPKSWRAWLGIGSGISFLLSGLGAYLAVKNWGAASSLSGSEDFAQFGVVVATEVALIVAGALTLQALHKPRYVSLWISFIVGIHFIPLAVMFNDAWLCLLTALLVAGQVLALRISNKRNITLSALVGLFTGVILLGFAVRGLVLFLVS